MKTFRLRVYLKGAPRFAPNDYEVMKRATVARELTDDIARYGFRACETSNGCIWYPASEIARIEVEVVL